MTPTNSNCLLTYSGYCPMTAPKTPHLLVQLQFEHGYLPSGGMRPEEPPLAVQSISEILIPGLFLDYYYQRFLKVAPDVSLVEMLNTLLFPSSLHQAIQLSIKERLPGLSDSVYGNIFNELELFNVLDTFTSSPHDPVFVKELLFRFQNIRGPEFTEAFAYQSLEDTKALLSSRLTTLFEHLIPLTPPEGFDGFYFHGMDSEHMQYLKDLANSFEEQFLLNQSTIIKDPALPGSPKPAQLRSL